MAGDTRVTPTWRRRHKGLRRLGGAGTAAITAGNFHTCARVRGGSVRCWGENSDGQLGDGTNTCRLKPVSVISLDRIATAVTAGYSHTCAVLSGGFVRCWGDNYRGQLGDGTTRSKSSPVNVLGF
jgi:alpha-tubulin suppressor-like RCC1 family protein